MYKPVLIQVFWYKINFKVTYNDLMSEKLVQCTQSGACTSMWIHNLTIMTETAYASLQTRIKHKKCVHV